CVPVFVQGAADGPGQLVRVCSETRALGESAVNPAERLVTGRVSGEGLRISAARIKHITQQTLRARFGTRSYTIVGQQLSDERFGLRQRTVSQLRRGETDCGIWKIRDCNEDLPCPRPGLFMVAAVTGNRGQRCHGADIASLQLQRTQVTGSCAL